MLPGTPIAATPGTMSDETSTMATFQKMTERFLTSLNYSEPDRNRLINMLMKLGISLEIFGSRDIQFSILAALNSDTVPTLRENDFYHFQMMEEMLAKHGHRLSSRRNQLEILKKIFNVLTSAGIEDFKTKFLEAVHKFARDTANSNSGYGLSKIVPVVIEDDA